MTNTLRLLRGYLFRVTREGVWILIVAALAAVLWLMLPETAPDDWVVDYMRTLLACAPFVGPFFRSPAVVGQPVSRRQVWTAQWLVATAGVTLLLLVGRVAGHLLKGTPDGGQVAASATTDFFGCLVCAGFTGAILRPRKSRPIRTPLHGVLLLVALTVVWPGAPLWSSYLRAITGGGVTTPGGIAVSLLAAAMFVIGLRAVPESLATSRRAMPQWTDLVSDEPATSRAAGLDWEGVKGGETPRWVRRKLAWAALWGVGTCLVAAVIAVVMDPDPTIPALTLLQRLSGPYAHGVGDLTRFIVAAAAATWATSIAGDLRLLRSLPLSRLVIAGTFTAGVLTTILASVAVQILAYRLGFGAWPDSLQLPIAIVTICVVALVKTGILALGRTWLLVLPAMVFPFVTTLQSSLDAFTTLGPVPMAGTAILILGLSMRLDLALIDGASRLYRVTQAM